MLVLGIAGCKIGIWQYQHANVQQDIEIVSLKGT